MNWGFIMKISFEQWCKENNKENLLKEWNYDKNRDLKPVDIVSGSGKKVWWICEHGHTWETTPSSRKNGSKCPYCNNRKILIGFNDLASTHPHIAKQWHPTKNGDLKPTDVTFGSSKKVWWQCEEEHEWETSVANRYLGTSCPYCLLHGTSRSELTVLYFIKKYCEGDVLHRYKKLGFEIDIYLPSIKTGIEYDGFLYHDSEHKDIIKNKKAVHNGVRLFRLREKPLTSLNDTSIDIVFDRANNLSHAISNLLNQILGKNIIINLDEEASFINNFIGNIKAENSLAEKFPNLAKEWHPTKNGKLKPTDISYGSGKRVWWKCQSGHEWCAPVGKRTYGNKCPYCSGLKVIKGENDLETKQPNLAKEWHPNKNGTLKPSDVSCGSNRIVWWQCECGHEWKQMVIQRTKKHSICPKCYKEGIFDIENNLEEKKPQLAKQWHPTKNGRLLPRHVGLSSHKKVWWICNKGHEWQTQVANRNNGEGCPICANKQVLIGYNDLSTTHPEIAKRWHPAKNGNLKPTDVAAGSHKKVWWICEHGHEWNTTINKLSTGHGCPVCSNQKVLTGFNDLATTHPDLAKEWHSTKNDNLKPTDVIAGSGKKIWWICEQGHEWEAIVTNRIKGTGCPVCAGQKVLTGFNDLATTHPDIAGEWHPTKNGNLTPHDIIAGSTKKIWWICKHGHEYQAPVVRRKKGNSCPYCSGRYAISGENDFSTIYPYIAKQWHPTKNSNIKPTDVLPHSNLKVWWICEHGHEWKAVIASRVKGHGCPYCSGTLPLKGVSDFETLHPELAKEWHPTKNGDLRPCDLTAKSGKRVWWQCKHGHEWETIVRNRTRGNKCPYCINKKHLLK